jgi:pectate lyase
MFPALTKASESGNTLSHAGFTRTRGGQSGQIVRVTNLAGAGAGSLAAALATKGPRVIVFEVGGVIDLKGKGLEVGEPLVTVAGQTAPSPGITLIHGGLRIATHDVILQHLRIRPGEAGRAKGSGWEVDSISTVDGARDVMLDHLSCAWATDENLSASGSRFSGATSEDWRKNTSHRITIRNCIIAEGLSHSTHSKGEHSKGSLIHDNATDIAILGNLFANNVQRNPLFKGGARGIVVNNLIVNPGNKAIHFGLVPDEWEGHSWEAGQMAVVGNLLLGGADTSRNLALMTHARGPLVLHLRDNRAQNKSREPLPLYETQSGRGTNNGCELVNQPPRWPEGLQPLPVDEVKETVLAHAGARPWDRDAIDQRIIAQARNGTGRIIDSETAVGGYPKPEPTRASFHPREWNLETLEQKNPPPN